MFAFPSSILRVKRNAKYFKKGGKTYKRGEGHEKKIAKETYIHEKRPIKETKETCEPCSEPTAG